MALKLAVKGLSLDKSPDFDVTGCNDFRERDKIRNFAESFADKL